MVDEMCNVSIETSINSERALCILIVKVKEVGHAFRIVLLSPLLSFLISDDLKQRNIKVNI